MKNRNLDRFGILLMDGEQLILEAAPTAGFVRFFVITTCLSIVGILVAPLAYLCAKVAQSKFRYWLTNRRIILSHGFLGFRVRSIPLERVSDVALSSTFPEMLAGTRSVIVRDMTGETQTGRSLLAIDNAGEIQKRILEEVGRVNSERKNI